MAVTFAVTLLRKNISGNLRLHAGTITASGTTSDDGDAITAAAFGLHTISQLVFTPIVDSVSNPENAAYCYYLPTTPGLGGTTAGKIVFYGGAASGSPQAQLTDGSTVTAYSGQFLAWGT